MIPCVLVVESAIKFRKHEETGAQPLRGLFEILGICPQIQITPPNFAMLLVEDIGIRNKKMLFVGLSVVGLAAQAPAATESAGLNDVGHIGGGKFLIGWQRR